jgi:hypothetical protein
MWTEALHQFPSLIRLIPLGIIQKGKNFHGLHLELGLVPARCREDEGSRLGQLLGCAHGRGTRPGVGSSRPHGENGGGWGVLLVEEN